MHQFQILEKLIHITCTAMRGLHAVTILIIILINFYYRAGKELA